MVSINFSFKTNTGKNLEFLQTIGSIIIDLRKVNGCKNIDIQQDDQIKEQFSLQLNWQNKKRLMALIDSKEFGVFLGAIQVLCEPSMIEIHVGHETIKIEDNNQKRDNLYERIKFELLDDK